MITRNCNYCKKEYKTKQCYLDRGQGLYCSLACAAQANNAKRKPTGKMVPCCYCNKLIYRIQRDLKKRTKFYCNRECRGLAEFNGTDRKKRSWKQRTAALSAKNELIEQFGVVCQAKCELDLKSNRKLIDIHHRGDTLDHNDVVLLCPYHHRLADNGYEFEMR